MSPVTKVLMTGFITHDVRRFIFEKPEGFAFTPGQASRVAVNQPGWEKKGRPFTPTSLPDDRVIEFIIKAYPAHQGVTARMHQLRAGDEVLLGPLFGTFEYHGPGVFIAGGSGITPFIAILRQLARDGKLAGHSMIFANKSVEDVFLTKELRHYLGDRCTFTLDTGTFPGYETGFVTEALLRARVKDFSQPFYVCGPPPMTKAVTAALRNLGANPENVVFE
jgi:cytochrome-b5 reductase